MLPMILNFLTSITFSMHNGNIFTINYGEHHSCKYGLQQLHLVDKTWHLLSNKYHPTVTDISQITTEALRSKNTFFFFTEMFTFATENTCPFFMHNCLDTRKKLPLKYLAMNMLQLHVWEILYYCLHYVHG